MTQESASLLNPELIEQAHQIILARVKADTPICYSDLYKELGINYERQGHRMLASQLLEEVNEIDGRDCLITAFIVSKEKNSPSEGFYALAEDWGLIKRGLSDCA
jgi:hypothetical protein